MSLKLFNKIIKGKITSISRICNLVSIEITTTNQSKVYLHIQSFFRILKKKRLIISSDDIYKCHKEYDSKQFDWDIPGKSIFDNSINKVSSDLYRSSIEKVSKTRTGDLMINFENDFLLQILIDSCSSEEKYRIFDETHSTVVYS